MSACQHGGCAAFSARFGPLKGPRSSASQLLPFRPHCAAHEEPLLTAVGSTLVGRLREDLAEVLRSRQAKANGLSVLTAYIGRYPGSSGRSVPGRASRLARNHLPFSVRGPASAAAWSRPARSSCKSGGLSPYETISSSAATAASTNSPQRREVGASRSGGEAKARLISSGSWADARTP